MNKARSIVLMLALMCLVFALPKAYAAGDELFKVGDNVTIDASEKFYGYKTMTEVLDDTTDTVGTVTAAKTGYTFIVDDTTRGTAETFVFTLPTAAAGLTYRFVDGSGNTIHIDPANADSIEYTSGSMDAGDRLISNATSGDSVTVVGASGKWYIADISGTWTDGGL